MTLMISLTSLVHHTTHGVTANWANSHGAKWVLMRIWMTSNGHGTKRSKSIPFPWQSHLIRNCCSALTLTVQPMFSSQKATCSWLLSLEVANFTLHHFLLSACRRDEWLWEEASTCAMDDGFWTTSCQVFVTLLQPATLVVAVWPFSDT